MVKYKYMVDQNDNIEKIIVVKGQYALEIPADGVPFSEKPKIEAHLNALFDMGVKIELLTMQLIEGSKHAEDKELNEKIKKFITGISTNTKKLFLTLDNTWKPKPEVDKALGFENNPQKLAGVLSGITKRARNAGFEDEKLIEQMHEGGMVKYRLTELGMKIKERLSVQ